MVAAETLWAANPVMHHWMSNTLIELEDDAATAATALGAFLVNVDTGPTPVSGLYRDRLERRRGTWRIARREFEAHNWTPVAGWVPLMGSDLAAMAS